MKNFFSEWGGLLIVLAIVLVIVGAISFNVWNFFTCVNVKLMDAPARCLLLANPGK